MPASAFCMFHWKKLKPDAWQQGLVAKCNYNNVSAHTLSHALSHTLLQTHTHFTLSYKLTHTHFTHSQIYKHKHTYMLKSINSDSHLHTHSLSYKNTLRKREKCLCVGVLISSLEMCLYV